MDRDDKYNSTDSGFELDKIDLLRLAKPEPAASEKKRSVPYPKSEARQVSPPAPPVPPKALSSRTRWLTAGACVVVVAVTALFWAWGGKVNISIPEFKSDKYAKPDTYISVGPVISSTGSGNLVKMTFDINCAKKEYRKQIASLDSKIRNRVVWALQTPEAEVFLSSGDYLALRGYLVNRIMEIIPAGTVTEIYVSEFLRY